jgi:NAD(P)-dependent dehydrogenase (short-subunit alcohol dehydrogenase family)
LVQQIVQQHGAIDILVNNAGINQKKSALEVSDAEFQNILQTNLNSVFALTREVAKGMTTNGSGSIINISSMASQYGIPGVVSYTASKSAIEGITKSLAVEFSPLWCTRKLCRSRVYRNGNVGQGYEWRSRKEA